ncbi:MAG: Coq4 family protein [Myxococcaceae bacterium]
MTARPRYDVIRAGKALKTLLADPDDLPKVFTIIEALPGTAMERMRAKILAAPGGQALLEQRPDIVPVLSDRDALRAMPAGSLAHAYLAFVESENISAQGILAAAAEGETTQVDEEYRYQHERLRDTHDLWHAATGYKGDVLGEIALLAFTLGQNWHPGIALLVSGAFARGLSQEDTWLVVEGFVRGKRAAFLPAVRWEELLALPVDEVRARLGVGAPPKYTPVRTAELRAQGII